MALEKEKRRFTILQSLKRQPLRFGIHPETKRLHIISILQLFPHHPENPVLQAHMYL